MANSNTAEIKTLKQIAQMTDLDAKLAGLRRLRERGISHLKDGERVPFCDLLFDTLLQKFEATTPGNPEIAREAMEALSRSDLHNSPHWSNVTDPKIQKTRRETSTARLEKLISSSNFCGLSNSDKIQALEGYFADASDLSQHYHSFTVSQGILSCCARGMEAERLKKFNYEAQAIRAALRIPPQKEDISDVDRAILKQIGEFTLSRFLAKRPQEKLNLLNSAGLEANISKNGYFFKDLHLVRAQAYMESLLGKDMKETFMLLMTAADSLNVARPHPSEKDFQLEFFNTPGYYQLEGRKIALGILDSEHFISLPAGLRQEILRKTQMYGDTVARPRVESAQKVIDEELEVTGKLEEVLKTAQKLATAQNELSRSLAALNPEQAGKLRKMLPSLKKSTRAVKTAKKANEEVAPEPPATA